MCTGLTIDCFMCLFREFWQYKIKKCSVLKERFGCVQAWQLLVSCVFISRNLTKYNKKNTVFSQNWIVYIVRKGCAHNGSMILEIRSPGLCSPLTTRLVGAATWVTRRIDAGALTGDPMLLLGLMSPFAAVYALSQITPFEKISGCWASARMNTMIMIPCQCLLFRPKEWWSALRLDSAQLSRRRRPLPWLRLCGGDQAGVRSLGPKMGAAAGHESGDARRWIWKACALRSTSGSIVSSRGARKGRGWEGWRRNNNRRKRGESASKGETALRKMWRQCTVSRKQRQVRAVQDRPEQSR